MNTATRLKKLEEQSKVKDETAPARFGKLFGVYAGMDSWNDIKPTLGEWTDFSRYWAKDHHENQPETETFKIIMRMYADPKHKQAPLLL